MTMSFDEFPHLPEVREFNEFIALWDTMPEGSEWDADWESNYQRLAAAAEEAVGKSRSGMLHEQHEQYLAENAKKCSEMALNLAERARKCGDSRAELRELLLSADKVLDSAITLSEYYDSWEACVAYDKLLGSLAAEVIHVLIRVDEPTTEYVVTLACTVSWLAKGLCDAIDRVQKQQRIEGCSE